MWDNVFILSHELLTKWESCSLLLSNQRSLSFGFMSRWGEHTLGQSCRSIEMGVGHLGGLSTWPKGDTKTSTDLGTWPRWYAEELAGLDTWPRRDEEVASVLVLSRDETQGHGRVLAYGLDGPKRDPWSRHLAET